MTEAAGAVVGLIDETADESIRSELAGIVAAAGARLRRFDRLPTGPDVMAVIVDPDCPVTAADVGQLPGLQIVATSSTGFDHVDVDAVTAAGAWVTNVVGYCTEEVAEHAVALILSLLRTLKPADAAVTAGRWGATEGTVVALPMPRRVAGTGLGLVGFGRTARAVARLASALGMRVSAHDPHADPDGFGALGVERAESIDRLLADSDVVSLHVPLTAGTRGMIDAAALACMRPGAALVNVARGGLVDSHALRQAIVEGHLSAAALDVLPTEPPPPGDPLIGLDQVVVTPHMAWRSPDSARSALVGAATNVLAVLQGRPPVDVVGHPRHVPSRHPGGEP